MKQSGGRIDPHTFQKHRISILGLLRHINVNLQPFDIRPPSGYLILYYYACGFFAAGFFVFRGKNRCRYPCADKTVI